MDKKQIEEAVQKAEIVFCEAKGFTLSQNLCSGLLSCEVYHDQENPMEQL